MPSGSFAPTVAFIAGADLRPFAGQTVLRRGVDDLILPLWDVAGAGVFQDFLDFFNGRGEYRSLTQRAQEGLDALYPGESIFFWLTEADRVYVECSLPFQLHANGATAPYGWPAQGEPYPATATGSGSWRIEAPQEWIRGAFEEPNRWSIDIDPAGAKVGLAFGARGLHQDVITSLRASGSNPFTDEDGRGGESLQSLDGLASSQTSILWSLDAEGRVVVSYSTAVDDIEWVSTSFRDLLGFTGLETPETIGFYKKLTSTYAPAHVLIIDRLARISRSLNRDLSTIRLSNGRYGVVHRGDHSRLGVEFYLRGPATQRDQVGLYLARFTRVVPGGFALNFYQEWGDPRRARRAHEVNATQSAYTLTRTSERDGQRGRILGQRTPDGEEIAPQWTHDIEMEARIKLSLDELEA